MPKKNPQNKIFLGITLAHGNFRENIWKTQQLLEVGLTGISGKTEEFNQILEKFDGLEGTRGRVPKNYERKFETSKVEGESDIKLEMDDRTAWLLKKIMEEYKSKHAALRFHLYAILAVTIWGAFETYLVMLYEEIYRKRPEILKSDENISFREALEHQDSILEFLIERQLDKIGHFTLTENLKYLKTRFNFEFSHTTQKKLTDYYLVRNIVAHNLGLVQSAVKDKIPKSITIKDNQIQITKAYLESMIKDIQTSTESIERFIESKFH